MPDIRRRELLDAGVRCLARLGPKGATGREICREAGVSHGLLRHYYASTDGLLLEAYQELGDRFLRRFEEELSPVDADPWEALARFFALTFADEWAGPDALGAWIGFWALVRTRDDFAAASNVFNARLRELLSRFAAALPPSVLPLTDAVAIQAAVIDGLWLDHSLSPDRLDRSRAAALCTAAARRLFGG